MTLRAFDLAIILLYFAASVLIGFWVSRRGAKDLNSYFLGGKSLPWYLLGVSDASGMFDISGTMLMVYWLFVYGVKSIWLPWLWPVFNQIFLMMFLSAWLRRSNVLTGAEWIQTRFGRGTGANLAHLSVVFFALVNVIGMLAYAFKGIGKFAVVMLPWRFTGQTEGILSDENIYAIVILGLTSIYAIKGGMISVVVTEVLQFSILTITSITIGLIAIARVSPEAIQAAVPDGWMSPFFGAHLGIDWTGILDKVNDAIRQDGNEFFSIIFGLMFFKGVLASLAGPAPNYDMQRILATRNPREACMMNGMVCCVLYLPRYMMITGLTVLALGFCMPELRAMDKPDFEKLLPIVLSQYIPVGVVGFLLAGLLAAFMSNFAATINAAPAYIVNDIYLRFIRPDAPARTQVTMSRLASLGVLLVGILFGLVTTRITDVMMWIVGALYGGYVMANVLKWYWWRFNGHGYFWGMLAGIISAMFMPELARLVLGHSVNPLYLFPIIFGFSVIGCFIGTFLGEPEAESILVNFYRTVRPWGFWGPIRDKVMGADPSFQPNRNFKRDMVNVAVGIVWQSCLTALPIYLVLRNWSWVLAALAALVVTSFIIKFNWYDKLETPEPAHTTKPERTSAAALSLLLCFLTLSSLRAADPPPPASGNTTLKDFITARGDQLFEGEKPLRFISFNIPNLHLVEDNVGFTESNSWRLPDRFEITDALATVRQMGGTVVRTYVISVRRTNDPPEVPRHVLGPGKFNEDAFRALDLVLQIANEQGVRVILPLVDNWIWWGGRVDYAAFRGKPADAFWTDPQVIADFKQTIRHILERTNTLTGTRYRDDKAILCWETGNELQSPASWTREIGAYIKSLDRNHPVMDGYHATELREESLAMPEIDIVTTHHYPGGKKSFAELIRQNAVKAGGRKPYVVGEIGFAPTSEMAKAIDATVESRVVGALAWSLRFRNRDGGFYWHSEPAGGNLYKAFHWPGSPIGADYDEADFMDLMRRKAFEVRGLPLPSIPKPAAPTLLPIRGEPKLSWQGSVGSSSYVLERASARNGPWSLVADRIDESFVQYRPLWVDESVPKGQWFYRVRAKNESGISDPSNVGGPVAIQRAMIVDEFANLSRTISHEGRLTIANRDCRKAKEDAHRLAGNAGSSLTYDLPSVIQEARLWAFFPEAVSPPKFLMSQDRQNWAEATAIARNYSSGKGDYGYWTPVIFEVKASAGSRFLKIELTGTTQLSRLEIIHNPTES